MIVRLFNPEGIKAGDYKSIYKELDEIPEFKHITGKALIFIWYYANPTSPLIDIQDNQDRCLEALDRSGYEPNHTELTRIKELRFKDDMEKAIERMGQFEPGARYISWMMVKKLFEDYQAIIDKGPEAYGRQRRTKDGETITETDIGQYTRATRDIHRELPGMIEKLERGFGISVISSGEGEELEGGDAIRQWQMSKRNNE